MIAYPVTVPPRDAPSSQKRLRVIHSTGRRMETRPKLTGVRVVQPSPSRPRVVPRVRHTSRWEIRLKCRTPLEAIIWFMFLFSSGKLAKVRLHSVILCMSFQQVMKDRK